MKTEVASILLVLLLATVTVLAIPYFDKNRIVIDEVETVRTSHLVKAHSYKARYVLRCENSFCSDLHANGVYERHVRSGDKNMCFDDNPITSCYQVESEKAR